MFFPHLLPPLGHESNAKLPWKRSSALPDDLPTQPRFWSSSIFLHSQCNPRGNPPGSQVAGKMGRLRTNQPRTRRSCAYSCQAFLVQLPMERGTPSMPLLCALSSTSSTPASSLGHRRLSSDYRYGLGLYSSKHLDFGREVRSCLADTHHLADQIPVRNPRKFLT